MVVSKVGKVFREELAFNETLKPEFKALFFHQGKSWWKAFQAEDPAQQEVCLGSGRLNYISGALALEGRKEEDGV